MPPRPYRHKRFTPEDLAQAVSPASMTQAEYLAFTDGVIFGQMDRLERLAPKEDPWNAIGYAQARFGELARTEGLEVAREATPSLCFGTKLAPQEIRLRSAPSRIWKMACN